jgi:hypothetical protein
MRFLRADAGRRMTGHKGNEDTVKEQGIIDSSMEMKDYQKVTRTFECNRPIREMNPEAAL